MRPRGKNTAGSAIALIVAGLVLLSSCGGQYSARSVNVPDEKLRLADDLFARGKYAQAGMEYKDFLAVFAGDERSDYAQYRLAESYRMAKEYALASVEYRILISDFGYSEYVDDAFFLEGLCDFKMTQRAERDQTHTFEALSRIERFLSIFPDSPRREEALRVRSEIHDLLGKKAYLNANLYFKDKHYNAAEIYFRKVIDTYPDTKWAGKSWYYIGYIKYSRDETDLAAEAFGKAVQSEYDFSEKRSASTMLKTILKEKSGG